MGELRDIDRGYRALVRRVFDIAKPRIEVGILSGQGAEDAHAGGDELTLIEVAVWNEFGTTDPRTGNVHVPERSFIRAWFDEREADLREKLTIGMRKVVKGDLTKELLLRQIAEEAIGQIRQRIADGIDPPNAEATIRAKGSSTPLINHGQLRAGVTSRIKDR